MEWLSALKNAISYMEAHLLEDITAADVAGAVHMSSFYFQRGFKIVTGYTVGEYLRNRRLYLAGLDVIKGDERVIDISCLYGYDTPESFTRAFTRFHRISPMQLKAQPFRIRAFLPLTVEIAIRGGEQMEYTVEKMDAMKMIGFEREVSCDNGFRDTPEFWEEFQMRYLSLRPEKEKETGRREAEIREAVQENQVGEFGICFDDGAGSGYFRYAIAGRYRGGGVPEGMKVFEIPACTWAKFKCTGPMPEAIQAVNTRIYKEWLPGNPEYEIAANIDMEWYSKGEPESSDYESAVWIPVKRRREA
ncbi:MAG: AraC family transcriptional regulator [Lachnospiraceae bacterium]|jgi:AraC family transcriptional regulator|nr:AraC family transcriptional regulator [Lachnospiraceae bacterium]